MRLLDELIEGTGAETLACAIWRSLEALGVLIDLRLVLECQIYSYV
jgi:hypothetical protein